MVQEYLRAWQADGTIVKASQEIQVRTRCTRSRSHPACGHKHTAWQEVIYSANSGELVPWRTDCIVLAEPKSLSCFDAAMVHAFGLQWEALGLVPLPPTAGHGMPFKMLNRVFRGADGLARLFRVRHPNHQFDFCEGLYR